MKYGAWSLGQIEALLNKLGKHNAQKLLSCNDVIVSFTNEQAMVTANTPPLTVWKTIKLGTSIKGPCCELEEKDFQLDDWARDILKQKAFPIATTEEEVDLVRLSVADLNFTEGANYDVICTRAIEWGLKLCPTEVGPQLRLQYPDQPRDELLLIAMEGIRGSRGGLRIFNVTHDNDGRWLRKHFGYSDHFWSANHQFIFQLPRRQLSAA